MTGKMKSRWVICAVGGAPFDNPLKKRRPITRRTRWSSILTGIYCGVLSNTNKSKLIGSSLCGANEILEAADEKLDCRKWNSLWYTGI